MWERSGGNKDMVDMLVAHGTAKNPDCKIKLTYIPHTEMVGKIAQGIASGDGPRPDGHGPDLRAAVREGRSSSSTSPTGSKAGPSSKTASKGHMTVATYERSLYGVPLYADVSAPVLQQGPLPAGRPRPDKPPTSLRDASRTPTRSPRSAATSRATTCRATAPAATSSPSAR
jgi:multiple sugar transport system substrate-binding protein